MAIGPQPILPVLHARVSLTSAQILAINTAPITLIPAPGANKVITILGFATALNYGTTTYSATAINFYYGNVSGASTAIGISATLLSATASAYQNGRGSAASEAPVAQFANQAIVASAAANPTTGNGSLDIDLWYTVSNL